MVVNEDGDVVESYDYFPFGLASRTTGGSTIYKFTEKELDNETDFYYFGARYYDAEVGRWLSVDPVGEYFTPYAYVLNNPLLFIDPSGMVHEISAEEWEWRATNNMWDPKGFEDDTYDIYVPEFMYNEDELAKFGAAAEEWYNMTMNVLITRL